MSKKDVEPTKIVLDEYENIKIEPESFIFKFKKYLTFISPIVVLFIICYVISRDIIISLLGTVGMIGIGLILGAIYFTKQMKEE